MTLKIFDADVKICGVVFKKNVTFLIDIKAIQNDLKYLQLPNKFIPDRFDHTNKWYKTPDGKPL